MFLTGHEIEIWKYQILYLYKKNVYKGESLKTELLTLNLIILFIIFIQNLSPLM